MYNIIYDDICITLYHISYIAVYLPYEQHYESECQVNFPLEEIYI